MRSHQIKIKNSQVRLNKIDSIITVLIGSIVYDNYIKNPNQKKEVDKAVKAIINNPNLGEQKVGEYEKNNFP